jgi:putative inorganic carbon (hco3(-)) transporter
MLAALQTRWRSQILLEAGLAALASVALGALIVESALAALLVVLLGIGVTVLLRFGVSLRAGLIGVIGLGQLSLGPWFIKGTVPKSASVALNIATLVLLLTVGTSGVRRIDMRVRSALAVFIGICILETFNPILPSLGYAVQGLRAVVFPILTIAVVASTKLKSRDRRFIMLLLMAGWLINAYFAGRQWIVGFNQTELAWLRGLKSTFTVGNQVRLLGAQQSDQDFGYLAAIALPALTALFLAMRGWRRTSVGIITVASLMLLFASLLRSALVGGLLGTLALLLIVSPIDRRRLLIGGLSVTVFLWLAVTFAPSAIVPGNKLVALRERVSSIFTPGEQASVQARQAETWPQALTQISAHPLGGGVGSAGPISQAQTDAPLGALSPDNGYLLVAVQLGLVGALIFGWMLWRLLGALRPVSRQGSLIKAAAFGSTIALMVTMIAGSYWSLLAPATGWAILVGLGLNEREFSIAP